MALILNIETSTEVCSVSLAKNGETVALKEHTDGLAHSQLLTVFIEQIFLENNIHPSELEAVAVSKGPGSYTGLRIGASVAKGLCYPLSIPLISVCSLEILAKAQVIEYQVRTENQNVLFCPMIDARRMEVYTSVYDITGKQIRPVTAEIINEYSFSELLKGNNIFFSGNGATKCRDKITHPNARFTGPEKTSAKWMQGISEGKFTNMQIENVAYFEPFYLKDFVATVPKNKVIV
jgi:tRNA threonylcarbamoyladenosine biosynthesis protein TsaB